MANRLSGETSPYLLQHRDNPVDWHPWGPEALGRARDEDRPILLSIGYSACHWCHVMERESFEDPATAAFMNEHFVCIKVDREERPDVDAIYMEAVQSMTGQGGWPLTAFCDDAAAPFYGGTYFPPEERHGMPSFRMVMEAVAESWRTQREQIGEASARIRENLGAAARIEPGDGALDPGLPAAAAARLLEIADPVNGGFGGAPKFPPASALELMIAGGERDFVTRTLDAMARGGIHDQVGGGFARYAVDEQWLVPHFEKMLYDNALLARTYLHGWQRFGEARWREAAERTCEWMLREMRGPEGGFYSALDADSEGEEGRFYVWNATEIGAVLAAAGLGGQAPELIAHWGVSAAGNFEGRNILHLPGEPGAPEPEAIGAAREALYEARAKRVWPGLDDKRLCSWNALAVGALADAGAVLGRGDFLAAARECAAFVLGEMSDDAGRLLRTWKDGEARIDAFLEDYAHLVEALLTLYEATFEARWFTSARDLADTMIDRFADPDRGGFFATAHDAEALIARRKDIDDHPIPSGNSAASLGLLRLTALTGEAAYAEQAEGVFRLFGRVAERHPHAVAHLVRAIGFRLASVREVALVGPPGALGELAAAVRFEFRPHLVLAGGPEGSTEPPLLRDRPGAGDGALAYVCQDFACRAPVATADELVDALR